MADPLTIISIASTAFEFVGGMQQASAMEAQGKQQQSLYAQQAAQARAVAERNALIQRDQAKYDSARMEEQALSEQATAQRAAIEERRKKTLTMSRARAVAGASGGALGDPTVLNIMGAIEEEGEYNVLSALYQGESAASYLKGSAALRRYEGEEGAKATLYEGATQASGLRYQGDVARYESKQAASQQRMATFGNALKGGYGAYRENSLMKKYAPKESISWNAQPYGPYRTFNSNTGRYY